MILTDLILPSRINTSWSNIGLDDPKRCLDLDHYKNYPYSITYNYNNRGFRDKDWPIQVNDLKQSIWCLGDSFTVGIGSPRSHTWSYILENKTKQRTINVSMDGASNNWMCRRACDILNQIQPDTMIIQWSYDTRREESNDDIKKIINSKWKKFYNKCADHTNWPRCPEYENFDQLPIDVQEELKNIHNLDTVSKGWLKNDELRRIWHLKNFTDADNNQNTVNCIKQVELCKKNTQIVHSVIPQFTNLKNYTIIWNLLNQYNFIPEFEILDLARDGKHYDKKTASYFVDQILQVLN